MKHNADFRYDLKWGQIGENTVAEIVAGDKTEVKSERDIWANTGNHYVEISSRGKPSGIDKTEAKWWFHILELKNKEYSMLVFRVARLKKIANKYKKTHTKEIGDYRASKCVVIPIKELFSEKCYELF